MNPKTSLVLLLTLSVIGLCALFPPRRAPSSGPSKVGRGFLLSPNLNRANARGNLSQGIMFSPVVVDGGRLAAECIFFSAVAGIVLIGMNTKRD